MEFGEGKGGICCDTIGEYGWIGYSLKSMPAKTTLSEAVLIELVKQTLSK